MILAAWAESVPVQWGRTGLGWGTLMGFEAPLFCHFTQSQEHFLLVSGSFGRLSLPDEPGLGWLCGGEYLISLGITLFSRLPGPVGGIPTHCAPEKSLFSCTLAQQELQVRVGTSRMCSLCWSLSILHHPQGSASPEQVSDPIFN